MVSRSIVVLKGFRDGIAVDIDSCADFGSVVRVLRQKVSDGKRFFAGSGTKVYFKGRILSEEEEDALLCEIAMIAGEDPLAGGGAKDPAPEEPKPEEPAPEEPKQEEPALESPKQEEPKQEKPKHKEPEQEEPGQKDHPPQKDAPGATNIQGKKSFMESGTAYFRNGLRSGQSIAYAGSVVVMGDANPGSEIVAEGNVIVLGALKGLAHAGALGDESCVVMANEMEPVQLRIAGVISSMPGQKDKKSRAAPTYAYVKDGKISIAFI